MPRPVPHCDYCGLTQANHAALWFTSTGDTFALYLPPLPFHRTLSRFGEVVMRALGRVALAIGSALGLITFSDDLSLAVSDRSKLLWEEARRRGIEMRQMLVSGKPSDSFRVALGGRTSFFKSLPLPSFDTDALRMDDKIWFKRMMTAADLPIPKSYGVASMEGAMKALEKVGVACVKPRSGSNGRHTFPYVSTREHMEEALQQVKRICAFASVEEQLEGNLCRATCVGGKLIGFLESQYPSVVGDGASSIEELVQKANAARPEGVSEISLDASHHGYLKRRGYTLSAILPEGKTLPLSYRAGASCGGSNREHGLSIHQTFVEPIERAAKLTGLAIVGFDLIIPDPMQPAESQRWGFIEANSLPWIDLHATPFYGEPVDLSGPVWDLWERS